MAFSVSPSMVFRSLVPIFCPGSLYPSVNFFSFPPSPNLDYLGLFGGVGVGGRLMFRRYTNPANPNTLTDCVAAFCNAANITFVSGELEERIKLKLLQILGYRHPQRPILYKLGSYKLPLDMRLQRQTIFKRIVSWVVELLVTKNREYRFNKTTNGWDWCWRWIIKKDASDCCSWRRGASSVDYYCAGDGICFQKEIEEETWRRIAIKECI